VLTKLGDIKIGCFKTQSFFFVICFLKLISILAPSLCLNNYIVQIYVSVFCCFGAYIYDFSIRRIRGVFFGVALLVKRYQLLHIYFLFQIAKKVGQFPQGNGAALPKTLKEDSNILFCRHK